MEQAENKILSRSDQKQNVGVAIKEQCPSLNPLMSTWRNDEFPQLVSKSDVPNHGPGNQSDLRVK